MSPGIALAGTIECGIAIVGFGVWNYDAGGMFSLVVGWLVGWLVGCLQLFSILEFAKYFAATNLQRNVCAFLCANNSYDTSPTNDEVSLKKLCNLLHITS